VIFLPTGLPKHRMRQDFSIGHLVISLLFIGWYGGYLSG
jgi:hypothetical protein